ncbi:CvpA family protein [Novosphingobium sp.]|uniref:CvpA family protein n=1 Tax=Novosphingobium sp. TaxID=1874826 RepID=UPI001EC7D680|nr:CvpA family protein [Novosphingobium sp.]MBK6801189.1 CvpA family protein [Novosphingobium sp.]MBK9011748.1 CvpA family protein [Novosphingobium sp.]
MTGFDIAVLVLVGLGAITGFMRGFVQEVLALAAWVVSMVAIRQLHTPLSEALVPHIGTESGAAVLAFAILLLVPYAIFKLLANRMGEASRNSVLGPIDRVLGFGFGSIKGMLIVVVAFSLLVLGYDTVWGAGGRPTWITQSRSYPFVNAASEALVQMIAERRKEAAAAAATAGKKD